MARNLYSNFGECGSFKRIRSTDHVHELDLLIEKLKSKPLGESVEARKDPVHVRRVSSTGEFSLPQLSQRLEALLQEKPVSMETESDSSVSVSENGGDGESSVSSEESLIKDVSQESAETISQGVSDVSGESAQASANCEAESGADSGTDSKTEPERSSTSLSASNKKSRWRYACISLEILGGVCLGMWLVMVFMNVHSPMTDRLVSGFQRAIPVNVSCEANEEDKNSSKVTLSKVKTTALKESEQSLDFTIRKMNLELIPYSVFCRNVGIKNVEMEGVEFPNIHTPELENTWRPEPVAPLFSDDIKSVLSSQEEALESLRHLEDVKAKYIPIYEQISAKVKEINTEAEAILTKLQSIPGVQDKPLTPEFLKEVGTNHPDFLPDIERLGVLRQEAIAIQKSWMELNQSVAVDLSQMNEKITQDGKAFSSILHYTNPTEKILGNYLFQTDLEKRFVESMQSGKAFMRMAEMCLTAKNRKQFQNLTAKGNIELFGQNFLFDSVWESNIEKDSLNSYRGNIQISSDTLPEELTKGAFITAACSQKPDMTVKTLSARIPIANDPFIWGDYKSFPLYGHAQNSAFLLDLTLFGNEIRGKISLEMNQVSFEAPAKDAELAQILFEQFAGETFPRIVISAEVTGTRENPVLVCSSPCVREMLPGWTVALQKIHQKARKEIIASVFEKLKNAETAFNGTLEPYYKEILVCAEKTDLFTNCLLKENPTSGSHEAVVEVVPMDLAHLEVNQMDLNENIPVYDPNLGIEQVPSTSEEVTTQVGTQAPVPEPVIKKMPVRKVTRIESLPEIPVPTPDAGVTSAPAAIPAPPEVPVATPAPTSEEVPALDAKEVPAKEESVEAGLELPPIPNVADPVLYSNQTHKSQDLMDIPVKKKNSMPLPMGKSTSNFGS